MHVGNRLRFRYLIAASRFAEALAISDDATQSDRTWALYRLGCYRSAASFFRQPKSGREALALAVSLSASGHIKKGGELLRRAHAEGIVGKPLMDEATRAIAPFCIETALYLAQANSAIEPGLKAALLLANEQPQQALVVIERALAEGLGFKSPDLFLLKANTLANKARSSDLINTYLAAYKLGPIVTKDKTAPFSAINTTSSMPAGGIRGPLITIVMPAYNTADRIGPAIESLLAQTYRDIEILVVDDASTDTTIAVIKGLAARDSRVRLLEGQINRGPYAARNLGLANALGEFITCHDSDDWAHPERIARQIIPLLKDNNLTFTLSNWVRIQDDGIFYARSIYPLTRLNPASPLFRKETVINRAGFYDDVRTGADSEYIARLKLVFGRRGWRRIKQPLVFGAHRPGSLMTDTITGMTRGGAINPQRLDYWEAWNARHIADIRHRRGLYRHTPEGVWPDYPPSSIS